MAENGEGGMLDVHIYGVLSARWKPFIVVSYDWWNKTHPIKECYPSASSSPVTILLRSNLRGH
jgi:hypothetical protein